MAKQLANNPEYRHPRNLPPAFVQEAVTLSDEDENWGTLLVRSIFHTWCHLGEISSIRQILGHRPPEFVNMYDWSYDGT